LFRYDGKQAAWIAVEDNVRMNMTNNNTRNTQKTGFINNSSFMYTGALVDGGTFIYAEVGDFNLETTIDYTVSADAKYVVIKLDDMRLEYVVADNPTIFVSYSYINPVTGMVSNKLKIRLPIIDTVQQTVPYAGQWTVTLYSTREAQKQSLSKALKPKADL
jgi:hypothetical protein